MQITRLQFVERIGMNAFLTLLGMAKQSVEVEAMMKLIEWATPDPDGTSINLKDPRLSQLYELEPVLVQMQVVEQGWADKVLNVSPVEDNTPVGDCMVYLVNSNFITCSSEDSHPETYDKSWVVSPLYYSVILDGATLQVVDGRLMIYKMVD